MEQLFAQLHVLMVNIRMQLASNVFLAAVNVLLVVELPKIVLLVVFHLMDLIFTFIVISAYLTAPEDFGPIKALILAIPALPAASPALPRDSTTARAAPQSPQPSTTKKSEPPSAALPVLMASSLTQLSLTSARPAVLPA